MVLSSGVQPRHRGSPLEKLVGHGVIDSVVPVFNVLISKGVIRVRRLLMPVWTLLSSLTLSFHPEGTDVRPIPLVVGRGPGQLEQHVTGGRGLPQHANWPRPVRVGNLSPCSACSTLC